MVLSSLSQALVSTSKDLTGSDQSASAASRVFNGLRSRIISLALEPDTVLSRAEIGKEYGVSQSPVREAILKLEQEGLVISYPQSKTLVTKINIDHARETQFLRLSVELEVARTLANNNDPEQLLASSRILKMQAMAGEDQDISEFATLDRIFHLSLYQAAGIHSLWHLIVGRSGHIDRLRRLNLPDPGKITSVLRSHEKILTAIGDGLAAEAEESVREHLSGTMASIPVIVAAHPDYFDSNHSR